MRRQDIDRKLERLHRDAERISSNLVELELDSTRQMLEASTLEGESAARRSVASSAVTELWRRHTLLEELLGRADDVRGTSRADELVGLLEDRSIELANSEIPITERDLLGSPNPDTRCSVDELLAGMSASFDEVKTVLLEIDRAWTDLSLKLEDARRMLRDAGSLAAEVGDPPGLAAARKTLEALTGTIAKDPLSVDAADVDGLVGAVRTLGQELQSTIALKQGFDNRIGEAQAVLERIRIAAAEGQASYEDTRAKIAAPQIPSPPEVQEDLERRLAEVVSLAQREQWREATHALEEWSARASASLTAVRHALAAIRAPVETRNRYRAMLEAYQVKAKRQGMIEDIELAGVAARAEEALYNAPTDLAVCADLVRCYQQAVNAARPTPESMR